MALIGPTEGKRYRGKQRITYLPIAFVQMFVRTWIRRESEKIKKGPVCMRERGGYPVPEPKVGATADNLEEPNGTA